MNTIKITRATKNYFPKHLHPHLEHMACAYKQALRDTLNALRNLPERDTDFINEVAASLEVADSLSLLDGSFIAKNVDLFV